MNYDINGRIFTSSKETNNFFQPIKHKKDVE